MLAFMFAVFSTRLSEGYNNLHLLGIRPSTLWPRSEVLIEGLLGDEPALPPVADVDDRHGNDRQECPGCRHDEEEGGKEGRPGCLRNLVSKEQTGDHARQPANEGG